MRRGGEGGEKEGRDREMEKATSEKKKNSRRCTQPRLSRRRKGTSRLDVSHSQIAQRLNNNNKIQRVDEYLNEQMV